LIQKQIPWYNPPVMLNLAFWVLFLIILGGLGIFLFSRREERSVVSLAAVFSALGGVFALMGYTFLGAIYLLIYAGAVVVAFLMVAWLVSGRSQGGRSLRWAFVFVFLSLTLELGLILTYSHLTFKKAQAPALKLGSFFLQNYLYVFELTSLLILTAVISSLVLIRREK